MSESVKIAYINTPAQCTRARESHCHTRRISESEKTLETRLRKEIEKRGGLALKLMSQLHRGLPDRLILMPCGLTYFAEIKTTGKKPTKLQLHAKEKLKSLTFPVFIIDSSKSLTDALAFIDAESDVENPGRTK